MTTRNPSRSSRVIAVLAVAAAVSLTAGVTGAQAVHWLPPIATVGQAFLEQEGVVQGRADNVRHRPLSRKDQALARRWSELFAAVLGEFRTERRDPVGNIEGDFTTREIRVRRTVGADEWVGRTLTKRELATADLPALAKRLYEESKR